MKKYPAYKDSGIEWLGEIPEHWNLIKLKYLLSENLKYGANESGESDNYDNPRYIRITDFDDDGILRDDTFKSLSPEIAQEYLLKEGDVLFARSGATVGKTFIFKDYEGIACFAGYLIKASPNRNVLIPEFLYFVTLSNYYKNWKNSIFIQATIQNIGANKYQNLLIPIPPLPKQTVIANFLDHKTQQIDDLIAKKERLIELLKEERTAIINHAVTKGLDPNVPMKDSGIEWLREIPKHWEVKSLKNVVKINEDALKEITDEDYEFHYIDIGNVTHGKIVNDPPKMKFKDAPSRARRIIKKGDTIVSTVRTYLKAIAFIDNELNNQIASTGFAVLTPKQLIKEQYLFYLATSEIFVEIVCSISVGVSYPATNASDIGKIKIWLPPMKEQNQISDYIYSATSHIETIIDKYKKEINLIKEYKTALINEAVTGKIDVRDYNINHVTI